MLPDKQLVVRPEKGDEPMSTAHQAQMTFLTGWKSAVYRAFCRYVVRKPFDVRTDDNEYLNRH